MVLTAEQLTKKYGRKSALEDFSYNFGPGIYGLLGPNGAGKTTLMGMITTGLRPTSGRLLLDGTDISVLGRDYRKKIGYIPQHQRLYEQFSMSGYLYYIAGLKGMKKCEADAEIPRLIERVNLWDVRNERIGTFSGGMKQRVLVAQAILGNPGIIVMDEPTVGLDPKERVNLRNLISDIAKDRTIIIATHIVSDLEKIASDIIFLNHGHIVESGTIPELIERYRAKLTEPNVEQIYMMLGMESEK